MKKSRTAPFPSSSLPVIPPVTGSRPASRTHVSEVLPDKVAERAYALWELAGRPLGDDQRHWFSAERELQGFPLSVHQP